MCGIRHREDTLTRLQTGLFDAEPAKIDAPAMIRDLRQEGKARTLNSLLLYLQRGLANRKLLEDIQLRVKRVEYR